MNLTIQAGDLARLLPRTNPELLQRYADALQQHCGEFAVNTGLRWCHFIAQVAHESAGFTATRENLNYSAKALRALFGRYFPTDDQAALYERKPEQIANRVYANRMGNGDEQSGDGWNYRGRGLIQLTGKANYQTLSTALGVDVVRTPDLVASDATMAVRSALWFWQHNNLNALADADQLQAITRRINGGLNGLTERTEYLHRAKQIYADVLNAP